MLYKRLSVTGTALSVILLTVLFVSAVNAEVPSFISYQGRLTDPSGNPVPDDTYPIKFKIYGSEVGDDSLWWSGFQPVKVTDGLFEYRVGSVILLPQDIFMGDTIRYLGVTVDTDPEILPRSRIMSTPYSIHARLADTAVIVKGGLYLEATEDTLEGDLTFANGSGAIKLIADHADLELSDAGDYKAKIWSETYGTIYLKDADNSASVMLDATNNSGGELRLNNATGGTSIVFNGEESGDLSARLPADAINNIEILNEPGIVSDNSVSTFTLTSTTTMQDLETVTINIPTSGYVVVQAKAWGLTGGTTGTSKGYVQIDNTSGGDIDYPYTCAFGLNGNVTTGFNWFPLFTQRVFNMSAGIHTFRLEGMKYGGSDAGAIVYIYDPILVATFYPTSYGTVNTYVSSNEAGGFDDVTIERVPDRGEAGGGETVYKVDLRELEIKAREARLRAQEAYIEQLEAERELDRARRENER